jgi:hypothetical protein
MMMNGPQFGTFFSIFPQVSFIADVPFCVFCSVFFRFSRTINVSQSKQPKAVEMWYVYSREKKTGENLL